MKKMFGVALLLLAAHSGIEAQELSIGYQPTGQRPDITVNGEEKLLPRATETASYVVVGNDMLTRSEFSNYLKNTDPLAYKQYHEGLQWMIAGWTMVGVAAACGITGVVFMLKASAYQWEFTRDWMGNGYLPTKEESIQLFRNGTYCMYGAAAAGIASAPLLILGYQHMHGGVKAYNAHTQQHVPAYWTITASNAGGLGIAYNF